MSRAYVCDSCDEVKRWRPDMRHELFECGDTVRSLLRLTDRGADFEICETCAEEMAEAMREVILND